MDELLTDLKSYDKHKAFRREAKAGGRLQGEMEAERSNKLFWAEGDVQAKGRLQWVQPMRGREGLGEEGCVEECVPIKVQGALRVLGWQWEEDDKEEGGQVEPWQQ